MNPYEATDTPSPAPVLLKHRDMQPRWDYLADKGGQQFGSIRAIYDGLHGTNYNSHKVLLVVGQASPVHDSTAEHIIFQLQGQVEFEMGGESYVLDPGDMLFIPAKVPYLYRNVGEDNVIFLSTVGRVDSWPPKGTYGAP